MYFDVAMPLTLLTVTVVSMLLNPKVESKLKATMDERELSVRDSILLVAAMAVMITVIVFVREISVALTLLFLFAYSMLLFTFTYMVAKNRWYVGIIPPALFVALYALLRDTAIWSIYLVNVYALIFAVLITLYLVSLFSWKVTAIFAVLLTALDIILVLVTGTMVQAAEATSSLQLPVLVGVPVIPLMYLNGKMVAFHLGLGDFFFAGLLGIQTYKKYGRGSALWSLAAMTVSFFLFEIFLLNYGAQFGIQAFPGTLMIITGWAPVIALVSHERNHSPKTLAEVGVPTSS